MTYCLALHVSSEAFVRSSGCKPAGHGRSPHDEQRREVFLIWADVPDARCSTSFCTYHRTTSGTSMVRT